MKTIKSLLLIGMVAFLSCQVKAVEPVITQKYSNVEIQKLIRDSKVVNSTDVLPSETFTTQFMRDFPTSRNPEWETANGIYEVEFEINFRDYEAYYDSQANLLMYKYDIRKSSLPEGIKKTVKDSYPRYRYDDVEKIHMGTDIIYKIELERGEHDVKLYIKENGTTLPTFP